MTRIYVADKETLDQAKANTDAILAAVGDENIAMAGVKRYGVKINKLDSNPATRMTYIYDATGFTPAAMNFTSGAFDYGSWGSIWFVKDNYPVMCKYDGTEDYKLSKTDHAFKEDGATASDVTNTAYTGNAMASMPKIYLSQYEIGNYEYIVVCERKYDSTYHCDPCIRSDGTEADKWYYPMFKGSTDGTRLRSVAGVQPVYNKTAQEEITLAEANGIRWGTKTWAQVNMMSCLIALITKSDNGQATLGNGFFCYDKTNTTTYGVQKTGSATAKGQFFGTSDNTHTVKAFYCEDIWANQYDRIRGLVMKSGKVLCKMNAPYNLTGDGYTDTGIAWSGASNGYIQTSKSGRYGRIPTATGGSSSTYQCDLFYWDSIITAVALFGGAVDAGGAGGLWFLDLNFPAAAAYWAVGASLSLEQPAAA